MSEFEIQASVQISRESTPITSKKSFSQQQSTQVKKDEVIVIQLVPYVAQQSTLDPMYIIPFIIKCAYVAGIGSVNISI